MTRPGHRRPLPLSMLSQPNVLIILKRRILLRQVHHNLLSLIITHPINSPIIQNLVLHTVRRRRAWYPSFFDFDDIGVDGERLWAAVGIVKVAFKLSVGRSGGVGGEVEVGVVVV